MADDAQRNAPLGATDRIGLREALEKMIPRSLDDVVRANRDRFQIGLATAAEAAARAARIAPACTRDTIEVWRIIAFRSLDPPNDIDAGEVPGNSLLSLLGQSSRMKRGWITSQIMQIDFENRLVQTRNSLYALGVEGAGEPPADDLIHLSAACHIWGFGDLIGAPAFFY
ncbi:MAG: hypothetical protein JWL84_6442 [Rhodospirillales bacterium]|nr:hypothetical protein [Rhodospirillales bacterium]